MSVEVVGDPAVLSGTVDVGRCCPLNATRHVGRIVAAGDVATQQMAHDVDLPSGTCGDGDATAGHALEQGVAERLVARCAQHDVSLTEHGVDVGDIAQMGVSDRQLVEQ